MNQNGYYPIHMESFLTQCENIRYTCIIYGEFGFQENIIQCIWLTPEMKRLCDLLLQRFWYFEQINCTLESNAVDFYHFYKKIYENFFTLKIIFTAVSFQPTKQCLYFLLKENKPLYLKIEEISLLLILGS